MFIVSEKADRLEAIFSKFVGESTPIYRLDPTVLPEDDTARIDFLTEFQQRLQAENVIQFDTILIDSTASKLTQLLDPLLKFSGVMCIFNRYIDTMKNAHLTLVDQNYYDIKTYELLKRVIQLDTSGTLPESGLLPHTGYITIGRKVLDIPIEKAPPPEDEFIEPLDVAAEINESFSHESKKVDYANLREDDSTV